MDELMKALECCAEYCCGECPYQKYNSTDYILKCSHKLIADLAAAGLKPERHGRWITDGLGDGERICSICRQYALYTHRYVYEQYLTRYCPNCGAKMDLEEKV